MSQKVFNRIKKQNGEAFAKTIRDYHNGILEILDIVEIVRHAGSTAGDAEKCLAYLVTLLSDEPTKKEQIRDPFELLSEAGYDAFYANSLEKQNSIQKYFKQNEALCTFNDSSRYQHYYMINAVKKDVDKIQRKDFVGKEERQDLYGTSVISIQVSKKGGFISIKNRYNHTVSGCDNTFKSNPDNIIEGLSAAIQKYFNVSFSTKNNVVSEGYSLVGGRNLFKIGQEVNGILYGEHAYVRNGELHEVLASNNQYLFDQFVFDAASKMFSNVDDNLGDCFPETFNRCYGGRKTIFVKDHCIYDGEVMLVGV